MKRSIILILILAVLISLTACSQSDAAKAADEAINAIGEVTLDSKQAINQAETIVDSLKSEDLEQVRGIEKLNEAKDKYAAIVLEDAIEKIGTLPLKTATRCWMR